MIDSKVQAMINDFKPISLGEMDAVKLLNRTDTKYVFESKKLPFLLQDAKSKYSVLHIEENPFQSYQTMYYDTPDKFMYHVHQTGHANRYKVRHRTYMSSGIGFLEVKFKNNKGVTKKKRISYNDISKGLEAGAEFLEKKYPYDWKQLHPTSLVEYTRITLVNLECGERVTVDTNLQVTNQENGTKVDFSHICIVELKRDKNSKISPMCALLKKHRIFRKGMSKYAIGTAAICDDVRLNRFKKKLRYLDKLKQK